MAWGSSQPRVEAWESSQPRVEARGSEALKVSAWGYVQLSILGKVIAKASAKVAVLVDGTAAKVTGGRVTRVKRSTAQEWCDYYGVKVERGIAILYKSVHQDYLNGHNRSFSWKPGTVPECKDWDAKVECGSGLHFSPSPEMAREFFSDNPRYLACPVRLKDIVVHPDGEYPQKVKAKKCAGPIWECDIDGERIEAAK